MIFSFLIGISLLYYGKDSLKKISFILNKTGAETRYWLDRGKNEKPIDHIIKASEESLKKANLEKDDIDLLI